MKIGVLTFHCAHNYGAVLQCYATQEFLRSMGHDVEIINYRPTYLIEPYKIFSIRRTLSKNPIRLIRNIIKDLLVFRLRNKRWRGFERFINNHLNIGNIVTAGEIPTDYDVYIVGSDQIWNPKLTRGFDGVFFCCFQFLKEHRKFIAYAASMEAKDLDEESIGFYTNNLKHFDAISVRETDLLRLLQPLSSTDIRHVLDPTLMAPVHIWDNFSSNEVIEKKYVVVYQVRTNKKTIDIANYIATQLGAEVKILVAWMEINSKNMYQDATPEDFVNTIRNAACVVTTSFHGTAFSVIFNRPFYTIKLNDGADSRSSSLLNSIGLSDRLISIEDLPEFTAIDYTDVNVKLDILRQESQKFILNNL